MNPTSIITALGILTLIAAFIGIRRTAAAASARGDEITGLISSPRRQLPAVFSPPLPAAPSARARLRPSATIEVSAIREANADTDPTDPERIRQLRELAELRKAF